MVNIITKFMSPYIFWNIKAHHIKQKQFSVKISWLVCVRADRYGRFLRWNVYLFFVFSTSLFINKKKLKLILIWIVKVSTTFIYHFSFNITTIFFQRAILNKGLTLQTM